MFLHTLLHPLHKPLIYNRLMGVAKMKAGVGNRFAYTCLTRFG